MAGKQYTELGYMLCNEPHWNSIEKTWASAPISEYAYEEFRKWLRNKHGNIGELNKLWGTSYKDFASVNGPRIMKRINARQSYVFLILWHSIWTG